MKTATKEARWDCHNHRDELRVSDNATVFHPEHGQLCWAEVHWGCILHYPIVFKTKAKAYEWIESGCIGDIQESWSYLQVGFSKTTFETR